MLAGLAIQAIAKRLQGDDFKTHLSCGGLRQSNWWVFAVGLGTLAFVVVVAVLTGLSPE